MISAREQKQHPSLTPEKISELSGVAREIDADESLKAEARAFFAHFRKIREILAILKKRRMAMGLSCAQAGELSGIDGTELRNLENSFDPDPTMSVLSKYAEAMGMAIEIRLIEKQAK